MTKPPRQEFERKFLVLPKLLPQPLPTGQRYVQGYLTLEPFQVRIRFVDGQDARLEIKGPNNFESDPLPLPQDQAEYLIQQGLAAGSALVEKNRHVFPKESDGLYWELDVFLDANDGLMTAEIEMPAMNYQLAPERLPKWLGPEVTDDPRFKNKRLATRPFGSWPENERQEIRQKIGLD
jgi:CYTH domain-containing protein